MCFNYEESETLLSPPTGPKKKLVDSPACFMLCWEKKKKLGNMSMVLRFKRVQHPTAGFSSINASSSSQEGNFSVSRLLIMPCSVKKRC